MPVTRRDIVRSAAILAGSGLVHPSSPRAQGTGATGAGPTNAPLRIGVLTDMTGPSADSSGPGAVVAVRMAVEDFGGRVSGRPIEVLSADHQNKADVGAAIARGWYDQGVDVIVDLTNSAVSLAVQDLARQKQRLALHVSPASSDLTGRACSPFGLHWTYDTYALASGTAAAVTKRGGRSWFFLTTDYAFGHALARDAGDVVKRLGGSIAGEIRHPLNAPDFSSYLLQAQASRAQVVGLANGSGDTINAIKQAHEFGLAQAGQTIAALLLFISDVHAIGLEAAQGVMLTEAFYWDQTDETRAWSKRFGSRFNGRMPSMLQAGDYTAVTHYLRAIERAGTADAAVVMAAMKAAPISDFMTKRGWIREDGRVMRDMYLYRVKSPAASRGPWDYYDLVATIAPEEAFRPLAAGQCPLVAPFAGSGR
ncbi:ABC transporter substrate-binding protein [Methylobacterium tarhaniae]|uniref:ABC transporter substrate-binding protein n=1 Tax=Methylobacterium tarhaniae TaxID=1187852 RepID=UPI003D07A8E8